MNGQALSPETLARLGKVSILSSLASDQLHCLDGAAEIHLDPDDLLFRQGEVVRFFWIVLNGSLRLSLTGPDGHEQTMHVLEAGTSLGEVSLLASIAAPSTVRAAEPTTLLQLTEEQFWSLMVQCPGVRKAILSNMATRFAKMQSVSFQQEKMASLGTLAAGLMHELNNPGAAARRAASQLRENLVRMHRLTAKWARAELTPQQKECMFQMQEQALSPAPAPPMDSIQQADAEDALAAWMDAADIEDSWRIAPTLVSAGIDVPALACAHATFSGPFFSDAIHWLEALVSSMQLVGTIEESIGRVTDLVKAVKSYAYEGRGQATDIDVNHSIHATLVILGHKLREKQITLEKDFAPDLPTLHSNCQGLNQVWTNLLDNAIDASPEGGRIAVRTWSESTSGAPGAPPRTVLCIMVRDGGAGIPLESQPHIFDPFYTTKPVGIGTGLGLGIVYRIVEQFGGLIHFSSVPGETEFLVRLPTNT